MRIKQLEVYGYGKLESKRFNIDDGFIQIYGENEAGKSTLQNFIHSILFGFPAKNEVEPRMEPRLANKYGGKLIVDIEGQTVEIERVKGKSQGDVVIYLEDGTTRDEVWLNKKMNFINKRTFQGIFSFNVLGLQDIHKNMSEERLQNYLLQAGALGSTEYSVMLDKLQQEKDRLYKKQGVNPILNQQIEELQEMESTVRQLESSESHYHQYIYERDRLNKQLSEQREIYNQMDQLYKHKLHEKQYHKEIKEWSELETLLDIEPLTFPEKGIERYELSKQQLSQAKKDREMRQSKLNVLEQEFNRIELDDDDYIQSARSVVKNEGEVLTLEADYRHLKSQIKENQKHLNRLMMDVGWNSVPEDIDDSNMMRERIIQLLQQRKSSMQEINLIERDMKSLEEDNELLKSQYDKITSDIVSDESLQKAYELKDKHIEMNEKKNMFNVIKAEYEEGIENQRKSRKKYNITMIIFTVVFLALSIYFFTIPNFMFAIIFLVIAILPIVMLILNRSDEDSKFTEEYEQQIERLKQEIDEMIEKYGLTFDLFEEEAKRDNLKRISEQQSSNERKYRLLEQEEQKIDAALDQTNQSLFEIKDALKIDDAAEIDQLDGLIDEIRSIRFVNEEIKNLNEELTLMKQKMDGFYEEANKLLQSNVYTESKYMFKDLNERIQSQEVGKHQQQQLSDQLELLQSEIETLEHQIDESNEHIDSLFDYVDADDEEEYYSLYNAYNTYEQRKSKYKSLSEQLDNENFDYYTRKHLTTISDHDMNEEIAHLELQRNEVMQMIEDIQMDLSDVKATIKKYEENGELSKLRHQFEIKKAKFQSLAHDYMSLSYLQTLIDTHIQQIKDERLPHVIGDATEIFKTLTEHRYTNVYYNEEGISVKHENGQQFHPIEVSQSTKELLYIALRFALIKSLKNYYNFPVIIDDAFVHFDKHRKKLIMRYLLNEPFEQILYFTCNQDLTIPKSQTIVLES